MGYYTHFDVRIHGDSHVWDAAADAMIEASGYGNSWYKKSPDLTLSDAKWYDVENHMRKVSLDSPLVVYEIEGQGEEHDDIWMLWAYKGTIVKSKAKISFPEPEWLEAAKAEIREEGERVLTEQTAKDKEARRAQFLELQKEFGDDAEA